MPLIHPSSSVLTQTKSRTKYQSSGLTLLNARSSHRLMSLFSEYDTILNSNTLEQGSHIVSPQIRIQKFRVGETIIRSLMATALMVTRHCTVENFKGQGGYSLQELN